MKKLILILVVLFVGCEARIHVSGHFDEYPFVLTSIEEHDGHVKYTVLSNSRQLEWIYVHVPEQTWEIGDSLILIPQDEYRYLKNKTVSNVYRGPKESATEETTSDEFGW
jgi:hypothetical protein